MDTFSSAGALGTANRDVLGLASTTAYTFLRFSIHLDGFLSGFVIWRCSKAPWLGRDIEGDQGHRMGWFLMGNVRRSSERGLEVEKE
jgi:hypothetical protein